MTKRIAGCCLVAMVLVSAVATASASAVSWKVNGAELGKGVKEAISKEPTLSGEKVLRWNGIEVTCPKLTDEEGFIEGPTANGAKKLTFKECTVLKPAGQGCTIATGEISTVPVVSTLEAGPVVKFKPKEGENFAEFKINGEACTVKGKDVVHGTATGLIEEPTVEAVKKTLNFTATSSALKVGEQPAELVTKVTLELVSKLPFTGN